MTLTLLLFLALRCDTLLVVASTTWGSSPGLHTPELPLCEYVVENRHRENQIRIGVILPFHGNQPWRVTLTRPALYHARDYIYAQTDLLPNYTIEFDFRDSNCSEINGPLEAIDMYTKKSADVFLGPACDYAIAPLARFTGAWGIPLLSAGAPAWSFGDKETYQLLTRVMGTYAKAAEFFIAVASHFNYTNFGLLGYDHMNETMGRSDEWFVLQALFHKIQSGHNPNINISNSDLFRVIDDEIGRQLKQLSRLCRVDNVTPVIESRDLIKPRPVMRHQLNVLFLLTTWMLQVLSITSYHQPPSLSHMTSVPVTCESAAVKRHRQNIVRIGVILPVEGNHLFRMALVRPAIESARDFIIGKTELLPSFKMELDFRDSKFSEKYGPLEAIDMYNSKSADLFLGPASDFALATVAHFTGTWGIPIMTATGHVNALSNKNEYKLLTRMLGNYQRAAEAFVAILKHLGYSSVGFMWYDDVAIERSNSECTFSMEAIFNHIKNTLNPNLVNKDAQLFNQTESGIEEMLKSLSKISRGEIFYLFKVKFVSSITLTTKKHEWIILLGLCFKT